MGAESYITIGIITMAVSTIVFISVLLSLYFMFKK